MLLGVTSLAWWHLDPKALRQRSVSLTSRVDVNCNGTLGVPKFREQRWSLADKEESSVTERICGDAKSTCLTKTWQMTKRAWKNWASFRVR